MNKLKKRALYWGLTGVLTISGCEAMLSIRNFEPTDRSESVYKELYLKKANEMEINTKNSKELTDCYGSLNEFKEMDNVIETIINKDLKQGIICGDRGDVYHNFFKTNSKK